MVARVRGRKKESKRRCVTSTSVLCIREAEWGAGGVSQRLCKERERERKLLVVSGPNAYQFLCS